ncbi:unnamed protein product [Cyprideis torosa]|uniref:Uncharacterized protein n=1 Tax=Cyprideis torosa TaxID=163714 RepID=A0A7R8W8V2_9CRUS|nr:unnamed protein product [Cyprideis torosa]CAG0884182.1 unnamed protein product [Cyprideis torosa]
MGQGFSKIKAPSDVPPPNLPVTQIGIGLAALGQLSVVVTVALSAFALGYHSIMAFQDPTYSLVFCPSAGDGCMVDLPERLTIYFLYIFGNVGITALTFLVVGEYGPAFLSEPIGTTQVGLSVYIVIIILSIISGVACQTVPYDTPYFKTLAYGVHNVIMALAYLPLIWHSDAPRGYPEAVTTVWAVSYLAIAHLAPGGEIGKYGDPLGLAVGVIFAASLTEAMTEPRSEWKEITNAFTLYFGFVIFSLMLLYDADKNILRAACKQDFDPICAANQVFGDILQLYMRIHFFMQQDPPFGVLTSGIWMSEQRAATYQPQGLVQKIENELRLSRRFSDATGYRTPWDLFFVQTEPELNPLEIAISETIRQIAAFLSI